MRVLGSNAAYGPTKTAWALKSVLLLFFLSVLHSYQSCDRLFEVTAAGRHCLRYFLQLVPLEVLCCYYC
jgi:hypothetical protein